MSFKHSAKHVGFFFKGAGYSRAKAVCAVTTFVIEKLLKKLLLKENDITLSWEEKICGLAEKDAKELINQIKEITKKPDKIKKLKYSLTYQKLIEIIKSALPPHIDIEGDKKARVYLAITADIIENDSLLIKFFRGDERSPKKDDLIIKPILTSVAHITRIKSSKLKNLVIDKIDPDRINELQNKLSETSRESSLIGTTYSKR